MPPPVPCQLNQPYYFVMRCPGIAVFNALFLVRTPKPKEKLLALPPSGQVRHVQALGQYFMGSMFHSLVGKGGHFLNPE